MNKDQIRLVNKFEENKIVMSFHTFGWHYFLNMVSVKVLKIFKDYAGNWCCPGEIIEIPSYLYVDYLDRGLITCVIKETPFEILPYTY